MKRTQNLILRYIILILGLLIMAFGIAVVVKSNTGTSPISSIPYVFSLIFPLTFGQFTFLLSLAFMLTEFIVLRREFPKGQLLQVIIGPFFGYFTDLGMYVFANLTPQAYWQQILVLVAGCAMMALGIYLQVAANVIINPGEGAVKAIAYKSKIRFSNVKITFDTTLGATALIISLLYFGDVRGIREGTVISAFLVGFLVKIWSRVANHFDFEKKIYPVK